MTVMHGERPLIKWAPVLLGTALTFAAVVVSLIDYRVIGSGIWGYWTFARVFSETREFIIPGRSPLYILYLQLFYWMGYPASVSFEYVVSILIVMAASVLFFRRYLGTVLAVLASVLWIPLYQAGEPPAIQELGIACVLLAVTVRRSGTNRASVPASFALLALAYMFRGTFIVFAVPYVVWDVWQLFRRQGETRLLRRIKPSPWWMLLLVPASLFVWFAVQQSDHKWNNAYMGIPIRNNVAPKSHMNTAFVDELAGWYDLRHPGLAADDKSYTNDLDYSSSFVKDIHGEGTILGIMRANPGLVARHVGENIINTGDVAAMQMTFAGHAVKDLWENSIPRPLFLLVADALLISLLWGAWKVSADGADRLLVVGTAAHLAMLVFFLPRVRYMPPEVPMLVMGAIWYGRRAGDIASKLSTASARRFRWTVYSIVLVEVALALGLLVRGVTLANLYVAALVVVMSVALGLVAAAFWGPFSGARRWSRLVVALAVPAALLAGSYPTFMWHGVVRDVVGAVKHGELRVIAGGLSADNEGMWKDTLDKIEPLIRNCRGIIAVDPSLFAAFTNLPLDRIYTTGEMSKTRRYGDSGYDWLDDWLRPDRIDCVSFPAGSGETYLISYAEALTALGAKTYLIKYQGYVTVLRPPP